MTKNACEIIVCRGLPASGKSTWAREYLLAHGNYKIIEKDALRLMIDGSRHTKAHEKFVCQMRDTLLSQALEAGFSVISADTNYHPKHEARFRELAEGRGATLRVRDFSDSSLAHVELCIERNAKRPNGVPESVIWDMYYRYLYKPAPAPVFDPELPTALIFDIDGTLALHEGRRNPYDTSTCDQDAVNEPVARIARSQYQSVDRTVLLSGRKEQARPMTEAWLIAHKIPFDFLWMRADGDNRPDYVVKEEIYRNYIEGVYNVLGIYDDRDQVVRLWRSLGLPCFQVAYGNF